MSSLATIRTVGFFGITVLVCCWISCQPGSDPEQSSQASLPERVDFNFHIKPILSDRCFKCHGPDENTRKAGLRFDIEEAALSLLDSADNRFAIVPGKVKKSQLIQRISSTDPDYMMPPPEANLHLSVYEIALLKRWIKQGAEWKPHWSFTPPVKPALPQVKLKDWAINEIDYFVLKKLQGTGLDPASPETKEKLLRRLSFDLTGLPPSPVELREFMSDDSPEAYEKQVNRLLSSTAYGERMASIWLEAARYADSHGYQDDRPRSIWPWRDWVINAFNENLPFSDFITWQLAGDLLPNASYEQKLATAFNRNHAITQEGGVINEEYITEYVADRTNTTATAFMGLTMQCARCHDHKYDPISQKDYYQMFAFFNGVNEKGQIDYFDEAPEPNMKVEDVELEATILWLDSMRLVKQENLRRLMSKSPPGFEQWLNGEYPIHDWELQISKGLLAYFKLDQLDQLVSPNEVPQGHQGMVNVKIISELIEPKLMKGKAGKAMQFDGKNYLSLGDVGDFEESQGFSFGGWVKPTMSRSKLTGLFTRRNGEQRRGGYELALTPQGTLQAALVHNEAQEKLVVHTQKTIPLRYWSHVFMTYDGSGTASGVQIFINGKAAPLRVKIDQLQRKSILNGNDFLVGNWTPRRAISDHYQGFQGGLIDEVRIYDRQLSAIEVEALAANPASSNYPQAPAGKLPNSELREFYLTNFDTHYHRQKNELDSLRGVYLEVPYVMVMQEMDSVRPTYVLNRGAYDDPLDQVLAGTPSDILPFPQDYPRNRLGLAQWLTHPDHPLTARVAVNRFWQMLFGRGLVNTPEDFGNQGDLPSHPQLLDWLAVTFREDGWDVKAMVKRMVLSATYRQSAQLTEKHQRMDPENVLLARGPYQRLSAEMLRDQALAASGLLNPKIGGKWVKPYQPPGIWKELANQIGENKYRPSYGVDLYRRSLYSYWKRTIPPPVMLTFDASERAVCVLKRQSTSTPLQALVLLNDPQFIEASRVLAQDVLRDNPEPAQCISEVFVRLTSRRPNARELANLLELFEAERSNYQQQPQAATRLLSIGSTPLLKGISVPELAALTVVTNLVLNLDEAKMES
ncbi:MAG: DUF1553 domain-containing protein [Cyclobacteriaceae bacterium]|nr:DUF1553 domain-containing protein [Cyclobacteriaceae bacterium]